MSSFRAIAMGIGFVVLAVLSVVVAWFFAVIYGRSVGFDAWCIGYPVLAVTVFLVWNSERWPDDAQTILIYAVFSVLIGALSLGVDATVGAWNSPGLPFKYAVWHAGSPFGICLTEAICPCFTLIALAGAARAFFSATGDSNPKA